MSTEILGFPSGETEGSPSSGAADAAAAPVLVGCSHGTNDVAGQAAIRALLDDVRATRPDLDVREAFVDVQQPEVADVVTHAVAPRAPGEGPGGQAGQAGQAVVVPLLLSTGFHVNVDITEAVSPEHEGRGPEHGAATAARALGPDPRLAEILADRLVAAGVRPHDAVVLAAAGSSRSGAARDVEAVAEHLRAHHDGPVTVGFGAMATPSVRDAVEAAREALAAAVVPGEPATAPGGGADAAGAAPSGSEGEPAPRVVIAAYLLAPGFFHDRLLEAGADVVTAPLAPDARLTAIVLDRYAEGVAALPGR